MVDYDSPEHRRRMVQDRLHILDAMCAALSRRREVFDVIDGSESADAARTRIADMLGTDEIGATAILDLQARRFARLERGRIFAECEELRRRLAEGMY